MIQVFEAVLENKPFIANIYRSVDKAKIENYLYKLSYQLIADVVDEKCAGDNLSEAEAVHRRLLQVWICGDYA